MIPIDPPAKKVYYNPDETEWLMQPYADEVNYDTEWSIVDRIQELVGSLNDVDQRVISLIFYERETFESAAKKCGLRAKSHLWRQSKAAVENLETAIRADTKLMKLLKTKYGIKSRKKPK